VFERADAPTASHAYVVTGRDNVRYFPLEANIFQLAHVPHMLDRIERPRVELFDETNERREILTVDGMSATSLFAMG
jgi:hypothetical protein